MKIINKIIIGITVNGLALYIVTKLLYDLHYTGGILFFIVGGLIMGILNTFVKPLMKLLSFPLVFMSAGLFILVINAILFWIMVKTINTLALEGISIYITNPLTYLWSAIIFGIANFALHLIIHNK